MRLVSQNINKVFKINTHFTPDIDRKTKLNMMYFLNSVHLQNLPAAICF